MKRKTYDPFTEITLEPMYVLGEKVSKYAVLVTNDEGEKDMKAIVSENYVLRHNQYIHDCAIDIMSRTDTSYGGFDNIKTLFDGKRYVDYFASKNPITEFMNGNKHDVKLGLMIWNSYDGSRKTGFEVFGLNPFCTNQYHSKNSLGFFALRHTNNDAIDIEDGIENILRGTENLIKLVHKIQQFHSTPLTVDHILDAKASIEFPSIRWSDVLDRLYNEEQSMFGFYQALTYVTTRIPGIEASNYGSYVTDWFTDHQKTAHHTTTEEVPVTR